MTDDDLTTMVSLLGEGFKEQDTRVNATIQEVHEECVKCGDPVLQEFGKAALLSYYYSNLASNVIRDKIRLYIEEAVSNNFYVKENPALILAYEKLGELFIDGVLKKQTSFTIALKAIIPATALIREGKRADAVSFISKRMKEMLESVSPSSPSKG